MYHEMEEKSAKIKKNGEKNRILNLNSIIEFTILSD